MSAPNFESFLQTPLPSDQKLLTLLHFNLVRALMQNVFILNLDPDDMSLDQESPFADPRKEQRSRSTLCLPCSSRRNYR